MKKLTISYKRCFISHTVTRYVPEKWSELTPRQLVLTAQLYLNQADETTFIARFFDFPVAKIGDFQAYELSNELTFLTDIRAIHDRFIIKNVGKLVSPAPRLKGITFEHFMQFDTAANRYISTQKEEELNKFVALLYLRENEFIVLPSADEKHLLSRKVKVLNLAQRMKEVAKVSQFDKYAIFLNYILIKRWLSKAFPYLFPLSEDAESDNKQVNRQPTVNWLDIFDSFVGNDIAQMDKYKNLTATTAFRLLNKKIKAAQK